MSYEDEKIIEEANQYKKGTTGSIFTGIKMQGQTIEFSPQEFFDGKVEIWLPTEFTDIPEWLMKMKYPAESRPKVLKMHPDGGIDFGFNLFELDTNNSQIEELLEQLYTFTRKLNPSHIFIDKKLENINDVTIGWFDYVSHVIDGRMYNVTFCMPIAGKMFHGMFNCAAENKELWKPVVLEVMRNIKDNTIVEKGAN
jgi:hypothetical protein